VALSIAPTSTGTHSTPSRSSMRSADRYAYGELRS
jgi:hypothetical protein